MKSLKREREVKEEAAPATESTADKVRVELEMCKPVTTINESGESCESDVKYYVDVNDDSGQEIPFQHFGYEGYSRCVRIVAAKVSLGDEIIGKIRFVLLNRSFGLPFEIVCDCESRDMSDIAQRFFKSNGDLKGKLKKLCKNDCTNFGTFMYIKTIDLQAPYDKYAMDENVAVAAEAINLLVNSSVLIEQESVGLTLIMYVPDGELPNSMERSWAVMEKDARQFSQAGFETLRIGSRICFYMYYEA